MQEDNAVQEVVDIVERICKLVESFGYHPEITATKWYDICFWAGNRDKIDKTNMFDTVREIAGDYFGEFYWAHSEQHIYIWFKKEKKQRNEQGQ
jgi:hypothetical protein